LLYVVFGFVMPWAAWQPASGGKIRKKEQNAQGVSVKKNKYDAMKQRTRGRKNGMTGCVYNF